MMVVDAARWNVKVEGRNGGEYVLAKIDFWRSYELLHGDLLAIMAEVGAGGARYHLTSKHIIF